MVRLSVDATGRWEIKLVFSVIVLRIL